MSPDDRNQARKRRAPSSYWSTLTDEELIAVEFRTNDPNNLPGIVDELPQTDEIPRVAAAYSVGGRQVVCVHDGHHRHGKGVIMEYEDGTRIRVGWQCADKIWGVDFDAVWKEFEWAEDKAHYLKRRNAARAAGPRFLGDLAALIADPAIGQYQEIKNAVRRLPHMAEMLDELFQARHGILFSEDKVRDREAEARREEEDKKSEPPNSLKLARLAMSGMGAPREETPKKKPEPMYKRVISTLGPLGGQDFFRGGLETVERCLRSLEREAISALQQLNEPGLTAAELKATITGLGSTCDRIIEQIARLEAVQQAFEARNLQFLVRWLNSVVRDGTVYKVGDAPGALIVEPNWADAIVVSLPAGYRVPSRGPFRTFRAAIGAVDTKR